MPLLHLPIHLPLTRLQEKAETPYQHTLLTHTTITHLLLLLHLPTCLPIGEGRDTLLTHPTITHLPYDTAPTCPSVCPSVCLPVCPQEKAETMRLEELSKATKKLTNLSAKVPCLTRALTNLSPLHFYYDF